MKRITFIILQVAIYILSFSVSALADTDLTSLIANPNFNGTAEGWTVAVENALHYGYQSANYSNGSVAISQFVEVWIPGNDGVLGQGAVSQLIVGLPEGDYVLEMDAITCNQRTGETVHGVYMFASGKKDAALPLNTGDSRPEHYSLPFTLEGDELTIGVRIPTSTNANWVAFDNVRLTYKGEYKIEDKLSKLVINEIQTTNIDQFIDPSFNYGGWVELYNPSDISVNLGGMIVSDDMGHSFQCPLGFGIIRPGEFKNLWFDHNSSGNQYSSEAYKQMPFKLQYEGGVIHISNSEGEEIMSQSYPPAIQRTSYARTEDGGDTWMLTGTPSPEASNSGSVFASVQLPMPVINRDAHVYSSPFSFKVTIPTGATLRYTTDGTTPTLDNGETSTTGSFRVSDGTQIYRFRLFRDGYLPSSVATRTFIYKDRDYYLPIVSVVTDARNLYDDVIGCYTTGTNGIPGEGVGYNTNRNRSWERPVNFEYIVPDAETAGAYRMALNQECDFEVCGGWSRNFLRPEASFRLKGNKYYLGQNFLPYPFFSEKPYIKNKTIVIRNGGNNGDSRIWDAGIHNCIIKSGFNLDCQAWQPAHIFINGEYKFMFNVREPNNKNHGYANYGIDTDEMDQFEINSVEGYVQKTGTDEAFRKWMSLAEALASDPDNESLYQEICKLVDIEEYSNYMAMECYSGCGDWLTNSNNAKGYRSQADGKFHLIVMDQDAGFGDTNMISNLRGRRYDGRYDTGRNFLIDIFLNMLECETFRKRFIDAFCIVNGSVYEPAFVRQVVNEMADLAVPAMAFDGHANDMRNSANSLINSITSNGNRNSRINNMRNYFGLEPGCAVTLSRNIDGGALQINGQDVPRGYFVGTLFAPITLTAKAPAGYRFKGWATDNSNMEEHPVFGIDETWKYYDQGSMDGKDWKVAAFDEAGWASAPAPFGYGNIGADGSPDYATVIDYGEDPGNKRPTYYFRKVLHLDDAPAADEVWQLTYHVDDGLVAYVNGVEIGRYLMHDGATQYSDYSTTYVGNQPTVESFTIPGALLHQGDNIIAVEVHNTSGSSSDIYWAASVERLVRTDEAYLSTDEDFTLQDSFFGRSLAVVATFEKLPDESLLADIATPVKVNEVSAGNTVAINEAFKRNDWIELYNTTDSDIDAAGLYVSDDRDDPLKYQIPSGAINTIIPAHGHLILWADKLNPVTQLHTPFKLGNNDGECVLVTSSDEFVSNNASFFEAHPALKTFADCLTYGEHKGDESVGRYPDGANVFYKMFRPTIARVNMSHPFDTYLGVDEGIMDFRQSEFALALMGGWNWMSHPFVSALPVNTFKDYANQIVGQTLEASYSSESKQMEGSLKALESGQLYKIEMEEEHTYDFDGQVSASARTVSLRSGWNWLGYPSTGIQTIDAALSNSPVSEGDIMLGQNGFAIYDKKDGWVGTLSTLAVGVGYMYKSDNAKTIQFNPAIQSARLIRSRAKSADELRYGFDKYAYPDVMGVVARLTVPNMTATEDNFTVLAYVNDECRGVGKEVGDLLFLTLYGSDGENVTFKALDSDGETYSIDEHLMFASDVCGTLAAPQPLTINDIKVDVQTLAQTVAAPSSFYTLAGVFAGRDARALTPGLYIVRHADGSFRKVLIK